MDCIPHCRNYYELETDFSLVSQQLDELVTIVYEMRKMQSRYFRTRSRQVLSESKALEKRVDKLIDQHLKAGDFQLEILGYEEQ